MIIGKTVKFLKMYTISIPIRPNLLALTLYSVYAPSLVSNIYFTFELFYSILTKQKNKNKIFQANKHKNSSFPENIEH